MRVLFFLSLVASTVAQTATGAAGASLDWDATSSWGGSLVPSGSAAVSITTGVTMTVNHSVTFVGSTVLTLGAAATAGTSLVLKDAGVFQAAIFTWANGHLVLQGNSNFVVLVSASLAGGASLDRQLMGSAGAGATGTFTLGAMGTIIPITAAVDGTLAFSNVYLHSQAGKWQVAAGAVVTFSAGATTWLISDATFNGGGNLSIAGELQSNATVNLGSALTASSVHTWVSGNLTLTGNGQVNVNGGSTLVVQAGARLKRLNANTQAAINVVMSGTVQFVAGTQSWVDANIVSAGNIVVDSGATVTVAADSSISGAGSFNINGNLQIAAGVAATFQTATFASGSAWRLAFNTAAAASTFATVTVKGALTIGGQLIVDVPVEPKTSVVLVTAASISGNFASISINAGASASGRRLLASGTVTQNSTTITYNPGSGSGATKAGFFAVLLPVFTGLALW